MKKVIIYIIIFSFAVACAYGLFVSVSNMNKPSKESDITGKDMSKEEYLYKEDLLELGYSIDEINTIQTKISTLDVKKYLLTVKYNNLISFVYSPYFKIENIDRYESYYLKNNTYSTDEIVIYVNVGIDNEFYTSINTIDNYNKVTTLINKYNMISDGITFDDLVNVDKPYSTSNDILVRKIMYDNLIKMIDAAKKDNITLYVVSGYRTYSKQSSLFETSKNKNGLNHALMYSAKPGHSEHELGLAVDLNTTNNGFEKTKEYAWLKQNAYKYGFILRYPKDKEFITGFAFEPWHYRYVGVDVATKIYEENITFEEYVVKYLK